MLIISIWVLAGIIASIIFVWASIVDRLDITIADAIKLTTFVPMFGVISLTLAIMVLLDRASWLDVVIIKNSKK